MLARRLKEYLDDRHANYATISHAAAFTSQETAELADVPGKELAKTVVVRIDGELAMVVLPAPSRVRLEILRYVVGSPEVELAAEREFENRFPDCELGAMPPFGNLYAMPVFVSQTLREDERIYCNAGSHTELIRLPFTEFERLVEATPVPL